MSEAALSNAVALLTVLREYPDSPEHLDAVLDDIFSGEDGEPEETMTSLAAIVLGVMDLAGLDNEFLRALGSTTNKMGSDASCG